MYYSLSWYDVNHKLQENYCVDVILSLETADDVNSKSFPLDSADIHMKAMLQSGKTKNAANTTSIYESKTRIVNIFYNPYREQPSQSEVKKSQGWLVSASRAAHFYEWKRLITSTCRMSRSWGLLIGFTLAPRTGVPFPATSSSLLWLFIPWFVYVTF